MNTEEIDSEDIDIFTRKNKFEELSRRFEKHRVEKAHLKGNDLKYATYLRKINKLAKRDLGLDVEAYKDFITNLEEF